MCLSQDSWEFSLVDSHFSFYYSLWHHEHKPCTHTFIILLLCPCVHWTPCLVLYPPCDISKYHFSKTGYISDTPGWHQHTFHHGKSQPSQNASPPQSHKPPTLSDNRLCPFKRDFATHWYLPHNAPSQPQGGCRNERPSSCYSNGQIICQPTSSVAARRWHFWASSSQTRDLQLNHPDDRNFINTLQTSRTGADIS